MQVEVSIKELFERTLEGAAEFAHEHWRWAKQVGELQPVHRADESEGGNVHEAEREQVELRGICALRRRLPSSPPLSALRLRAHAAPTAT